jgi:hypothetical protein
VKAANASALRVLKKKQSKICHVEKVQHNLSTNDISSSFVKLPAG